MRECDAPHLDGEIASLAAGQHAIVTLNELRSLGLSERAVHHRAKVGRLHRLYQGVYAVGHTVLTREGRWLAAVRAYGARAVLSQSSAAALHGLRQTNSPTIDVTIASTSGRKRPGVALHRCRSLAAEDIDVVEQIRCTTVARTILDIAAREPRRNVERLIDQAEVLRLFDLRALEAALDRASGHRGVGVIRSILADYEIGENLTRNDFEEALFQICDDTGLPRPELNVWIPLPGLPGGGVEVDQAWRRQKVIAEADGYAVHSTRRAFAWDRVRDRYLRKAGWQVLRFTWREVMRTPEVVVEDLRAALAEG